MKTATNLLLLSIISLGHVGCSKKNAPATPDYSQLILGKWVSGSLTARATTNGTTITTYDSFNYGDVYDVFTANTITSYFKTASVVARPYTVSGNTYTIDDGGGATRKFEILSLNTSSFVRRDTVVTGSTTTVTTTILVR